MKYIFEQSNGNGQSQCSKCGIVEWDCFSYKVKNFDDKRVCNECKEHMENGTEDLIKIRWKGFKPRF